MSQHVTIHSSFEEVTLTILQAVRKHETIVCKKRWVLKKLKHYIMSMSVAITWEAAIAHFSLLAVWPPGDGAFQDNSAVSFSHEQ